MNKAQQAGPNLIGRAARGKDARSGLAGLELAVDHVEQDRSQRDPGELVPVKEWKAEKCRRGARIQAWKAQTEVRQRQQKKRPPGAAGGAALGRGNWIHWQDANTLRRVK